MEERRLLSVVSGETSIDAGDPGTVTYYYVNDGSTSNDAWCTAAGDDANDGLTPGRPKATIRDVINDYDLEPGDVVRIDTGTYLLTASITIRSSDQGDSTAPVTFEASPYGVTLDRGDTIFPTYIWNVDHANYVTITTAESSTHPAAAQRWMKVTGADWDGIFVHGSAHVTIDRLEISSNSEIGVRGHDTAYLEVTNNVIHDNGTMGVYLYSCSSATVEGNTSAFNGAYQLYVSTCSATVRNNILWADGSGNRAVHLNSTIPCTFDYNLLYATSGAWVSNYGSALAQWQSITWQDLNSISADPLFVDAAGGDFHLQSTTGSYHDGVWTADAASSPAIDRGDPSSEFAEEPLPNGRIVNLGVYGNSEQGSKSSLDYGDAPSPYPTLLAGDGARHAATGPMLGVCRDAELDGQASLLADGDDANGEADEDGIVATSSFVLGMTDASVDVLVSGDSYVNVWIDFNGDGTWDASEQVATDMALTAGTNHVTFAVPATAVRGVTYARLRLTSYDTGGTLLPTGLANDGEVEDHLVEIEEVLYLYGTAGDDTVMVTTDGSNHTVTINGASDVYSAASYSSIVIDGDGGSDWLTVYDWSGDDTFVVDSDQATMDWGSDGVDIAAFGFETVKGVATNGGTDAAALTGTSGADKFYGKEMQADMYDAAGTNYRYTASGFDTVTGASGGGGDTAYLYGSTRDDALDVTVGSATMSRSGSTTTAASGFAYLNGYAVAGGADTATMTGTTRTDLFTGKETYAYMRNVGGVDYLLYAASFGKVTAYGDGFDTAYLYGGISDDTLEMGMSSSTMTRSGSTASTAFGFGTVNGYGGAGGTDTATLTGTTGADLFSGRETFAYMRNEGGSDYFLYAASFDEVTGYGNGGTDDVAYLYGSSGDDRLDMTVGLSTMTRTGSTLTVANDFATVNGYAVPGGSDTVTLSGSTGTDKFYGRESLAYMRNVGGADYFHYAQGFSEMTANGNGGGDVACLYGSTSDDTLELNVGSATMTRSGSTRSVVDGFANIQGYAIAGGTDTATLTGTTGSDLFYGKETYAYMKNLVGTPYVLYAAGFSEVTAYGNSPYPHNDTAYLYGSSRDDALDVTMGSATMTRSGSTTSVANDFRSVYGIAVAGGTDTAKITGSTGDDVFQAKETYSTMTARFYYCYAADFGTVEAYGNGGNDEARLYDSAGDDSFSFSQNDARAVLNPLAGSAIEFDAYNFNRIYAYATGGTDVAQLAGTTGADTFIGQDDWGALADSDWTHYYNFVRYFDEVYADAGDTTSGNDTLDVLESGGTWDVNYLFDPGDPLNW